jgi:PAS domain S-box-containing protein
MDSTHSGILIVEDEAAHIEAIRRALQDSGLAGADIRVAGTLQEYRKAVAASLPKLALMDLNLPDGCAVEVLTCPPEAGPFPILLMTSYGNQHIAVEAIKAGALDYIVKSPEAFAGMPRSVERAMREWELLQERKRAQEELREVTQRLQLATASGQLGIWDWDIVSDALVWNDRMFELYGVSRDSFQGCYKAWENCLHPDDRDTAKELLTAALSGEKKYDLEFRVVHPDGTVKFIKSNALVIRDGEGKAIRLTGMNQDITEHRHLEEQLRQAQKMEAVGLLAGGVAHDFNNILMAIFGYCSILKMKIRDDSPYKSEIDSIYTAAERAANLTRSLLAFSREQVMSPKTVSPNEIVKNVLLLLARVIGEDIQLNAVYVEKPIRILADSGQIEQVLINLAANARDAMPNGGLLTIETEIQEIGEDFIQAHGFGASGKYAVLSVSDTGEGMNAETSKKIFEPFFTTKEVGRGTGLGLSIAYGVIKQHGGYINVYSEPGKGTTFRIYLPLVNEDEADIEEETVPEYPRMGSETILVAEDDATIRELMESILKKFGYDVILAHDGEDAVRKFKASKKKIAIIVMDMIMPGKSGKEAYEEIRKVRDDVKILFMSGYSPDLLQHRGIFDNSLEVLTKPIHPLDLVRKVRAVLDLSPGSN